MTRWQSSVIPRTAVPRWAPANPVFLTRTMSVGAQAILGALLVALLIVVIVLMLIAIPIMWTVRKYRERCACRSAEGT